MGDFATTTSLATLMIGVNFDSFTTLALKLVARGEARVRSVLLRRYDLTSSSFTVAANIPQQVKEWSEMLAEGHMWKAVARAGAGKEAMARGDSLIKEVMADLKLLGAYELDLVGPTGQVIVDMSDTSFRVLCNTSNYTPTFDEGAETSWVPDADKLEDIADAKD